MNSCYLISLYFYRTLIGEIEAIKSGEAIYNPKLMTELRRAILQVRADVQTTSAEATTISADLLRNWTPTKEELQVAARAGPTSSVPSTKPNDIPAEEPAQKTDATTFSTIAPNSPVPAVSTVVSPSPTPTPTPSVVVNGEILKPYPSSDVQTTDRADEVPPLQIQPKRPKEIFTRVASAGYNGSANGGYDDSQGERPLEVKQEPTTVEPQPKAAPIRHDLSKTARNATASPSPPVSEPSATAQAPRTRPSMEIKSTSASHVPMDVTPSYTPIKREVGTMAPRSDRSSTAGVYNHRKIPVKNAASHSVTSGPSLMGEKRPVVVEEPTVIKDPSEPDVIVPDSQEVPDSQDEAGNNETVVKVSVTRPSATATAPSPRKATRATKRVEVGHMSSTLPAQSSDRDQQSDDESNRSELTTPPASPALSAPPSSIERKVKNEEDSADTDMLSPIALSPVTLHHPSNMERKARRAMVSADATKGASNRGRKRARESEGGVPSTPAKRPYQKSGNNQSQGESSPAVPANDSKADDTDDDDREGDGTDITRRGRNRRTSTRGKPSTIDEDSEDSGNDPRSVERPGRKRGPRENDQASKSS